MPEPCQDVWISLELLPPPQTRILSAQVAADPEQGRAFAEDGGGPPHGLPALEVALDGFFERFGHSKPSFGNSDFRASWK
jgi:hypothetical protein